MQIQIHQFYFQGHIHSQFVRVDPKGNIKIFIAVLLEITQMPINSKTKIQILVYSQSGILYNNDNE